MSWKSRIAPLRDVATRGDLDVVKLALQKEIEQAWLSTTKGDRTGKALAPKRDQMGKEGGRERQGRHHKVGNWDLVLQTRVIVSVIALLR